MKALVWHGKQDVRYETVPDPQIEDGRDAIIKVTSCAICGSDLHLFHNLMPGMKLWNRCRSEPQMAQLVTLMMASRPSSISGSGTVS